jgi:GTPase
VEEDPVKTTASFWVTAIVLPHPTQITTGYTGVLDVTLHTFKNDSFVEGIHCKYSEIWLPK